MQYRYIGVIVINVEYVGMVVVYMVVYIYMEWICDKYGDKLFSKYKPLKSDMIIYISHA